MFKFLYLKSHSYLVLIWSGEGFNVRSKLVDSLLVLKKSDLESHILLPPRSHLLTRNRSRLQPFGVGDRCRSGSRERHLFYHKLVSTLLYKGIINTNEVEVSPTQLINAVSVIPGVPDFINDTSKNVFSKRVGIDLVWKTQWNKTKTIKYRDIQ